MRSAMNQSGLTLIEVLVTITILGILASVAVPLSQMTVKREKELELRRSLRGIRSAIDAYKRVSDEGRIKKSIDESGYPPDLETLVEGVEDASTPDKKTIKFLRRVPRDPMNPDTSLPSEEPWGLRSYESDPDSPSEGEDVFDVYSLSEETAIDGTRYDSW